ncbi:F-box/kelch-repeat protein At3g23880-like [Papaver somniferum]|uniref:F-box/kelch-repeat protein At3g23880-like n=1 Tax=Papaver somniferum TaxID=3469 RepID=UPI000E6F912F|nr:F-box/kelch-repeat protein At3g23880-like [Papaver somniferum]XP_026427138.1 F-box/kelch-repeat protein At3g23880-like [Papaver somniferum]XP_026427139.1 F-box/kelch-repeat protein At3g23880-like [Papaver somniferum]XP_026427141.1 F-box/kelch-repeat protein At3g23880-like [Papaver somniferum]XP_026427142.1 F-box/kelch-repeat protein At3g23880-like [Papaver somniferum]XP_026427143.1 F-box/kelch-repeat protein At3g23880-like [Papaver somniferum]XP_026427144.1 F-box/kelch-repeat protein At3g2
MSISSRTRSKLNQRESISLFLNLPEGVHDEIFLKLPAKSILVSWCVCKLFCNLLSKPNFIKNHSNRTNQSKTSNPKLLFTQIQSSGGKPPLIYSMPIDYSSIPSAPPSDGALLINYPFEFLGSCNGLICLRIFSIDRANFHKEFISATKFCILNPLTREFKEFKRPEESYSNVSVSYGFGYDSNIDDYKLVMISDCEKGACCKIDVYTVKSDSWSSIQGTVKFSCLSGEGYNGVFFNGCLHWFGSIGSHETSSEVIFSFDISNEIVVNMPLPKDIMLPTDYTGEVTKNVGVWGDCIGLAIFWDPVRIDVWVMQEYGVKESWIRKYTTTRLPARLQLQEIPFWKPQWCFNNGEILVDCGRQILLYEPKTGRVTLVVIRDITMGRSRESYVESIVSLGSGTYLEKPITDGVMKNSQ